MFSLISIRLQLSIRYLQHAPTSCFAVTLHASFHKSAASTISRSRERLDGSTKLQTQHNIHVILFKWQRQLKPGPEQTDGHQRSQTRRQSLQARRNDGTVSEIAFSFSIFTFGLHFHERGSFETSVRSEMVVKSIVVCIVSQDSRMTPNQIDLSLISIA